MSTARPMCLLRGRAPRRMRPGAGRAGTVPPAPPAAAARPSTAHTARRFPGRHPRRGRRGSPLPQPAPASRRDGTGRDRTGRDGTGCSSRCSSGFSRPAAARPQALRQERCRRDAGRGQPPLAPGSPGAGATDVPRHCLRRHRAPSPGAAPRAAGPQPMPGPGLPQCRQGRAKLRSTPRGCQTRTTRPGRSPAPAWGHLDGVCRCHGCKSPTGPLTGTGALPTVRIHVRTHLTPPPHVSPARGLSSSALG